LRFGGAALAHLPHGWSSSSQELVHSAGSECPDLMPDNLSLPNLGFYPRVGKRVLDLGVAIPAVILLAPLFALIALVVRLTSPGGSIYRQQRVGRGGKPFRILKFRTMYAGSEESWPIAASHDDPRVTSVGRFLRRWKLDELPQLWNVVRGDMSLVGPRPLVEEQLERSSPAFHRSVLLRPGITSIASICYRDEGSVLIGIGNRDEFYGRAILPRKEMLNDRYLGNLSLRLDLRILLLTAFLLLFPGRLRDTMARTERLEWRPYSRAAQMAIDILIFAVSIRAAYWLRYESTQPAYVRAQMFLLILFLPLVRCAISRFARVYDHVWLHFSMEDAATLVGAAAAPTGVLLLLRVFLHTAPEQFPYLRVPLSVICGEYLLTILGLMTARALRKASYDLELRHRPPQGTASRRLLIAGAGSTSVMVASHLRQRPEYEVIGFVDDDRRKVGKRIVGIQVLGTCGDIPRVVTKFKIDKVAICLPYDDEAAVGRIKRICLDAGVPSSVIPDLDATISEAVSESASRGGMA
jgi:lipopolysaccharide/colanic/teichoic acid biosynthesis glycosyltransferase